MKYLHKVKRRYQHWWHINKAFFCGDPVRTWCKTKEGKYTCDGDCGRWSLHGVCTCGISHWFKMRPATMLKEVDRDNVSWHREYQTQQTMLQVPYENECPHGLSWNDKCEECKMELDIAMEQFFKEWNGVS